MERLFPSPHGDFVFELTDYDETGKQFSVSVPSRGFCFRTPDSRNYSAVQSQVSVPSRGFCFRTKEVVKMKKMIFCSFPSPHGDFVFEQAAKVVTTVTPAEAFPSPHGDFVFER